MTDPDLAAQPFVEGPNRIERQLADVLRRAQRSGEIAPEIDAPGETARLIALSHGLGTGVLVGQRTAESAAEVMRYDLDRLFDERGLRMIDDGSLHSPQGARSRSHHDVRPDVFSGRLVKWHRGDPARNPEHAVQTSHRIQMRSEQGLLKNPLSRATYGEFNRLGCRPPVVVPGTDLTR